MSQAWDSYSGVKNLFVLGITSSAFAAGGILFTSWAHVPAYTLNSNDENLLSQWTSFGAIGAKTTPPLALIAAGANLVNSYLTYTQPQHWRFLGAGVLSLAILPYTFVTLAPTNAELSARSDRKEISSPDTGLGNVPVRELIDGWSTKSAVRSWLLLASALVSCDAMLHLTF